MKKGQSVVEVTMDKNIMVIKIDTDAEGLPSKTGKSHVVATTNGFTSVGACKLSLNLIK